MSAREEWLLALAAERAARRPNFLGWLLSQYLSSEGISPEALAAELGCTETDVRRLNLCLRPRSNRFSQDINAIASKLSVDGMVLARIVRRAEALEAMAGRKLTGRGSLMAARRRRTKGRGKKKQDGSSR